MNAIPRPRPEPVEVPMVTFTMDGREITAPATETLIEIAPKEVWVTHGREDALVHWCETRQIKARALDLVGYDDEDD